MQGSVHLVQHEVIGSSQQHGGLGRGEEEGEGRRDVGIEGQTNRSLTTNSASCSNCGRVLCASQQRDDLNGQEPWAEREEGKDLSNLDQLLEEFRQLHLRLEHSVSAQDTQSNMPRPSILSSARSLPPEGPPHSSFSWDTCQSLHQGHHFWEEIGRFKGGG